MVKRSWLLALALAGCSTPHPPVAAVSAPPSPAATPMPAAAATRVPVHIEAEGAKGTPTVLTETKGGRRVYTVRARSFAGDAAGSGAGHATLEQPHITFLDRSGKTTVADAPQAQITQRDKSIVMTGGVRARTSDGTTLRCDRLRYDGRTELFHGDGDVVLTGVNGLSLAGDTVDGDVRLQNVKIAQARR